ncbi:MAG: HlyC/CorC family transporter [Aestuariivirga sp.]|uniref:hemolysin family protein n=1 Tax=Aestuariivirga sp. TaxID=2650926 RepID=UPI0025C645BC|nr:hemolysin family protein [Aestuariivirga sp.]MCA3562168.1 HlyC/CorC family transporter [Aestuariivirga sp.]
MSETDRPGGTAPPDTSRESLWQRLRSRFGRNRDVGLRESLEGAIESHEAQNPGETVGEEAKSMMLNIIEFSGLRVDDVMVPRVDIVAVDETGSMQELLSKFIDANHSRMPVYRETLDGITGMIHVKDFLRWMASRGTRKRRAAKTEKTGTAAPPGLSIAATALSTTVKQAGLNREVLFVPPSMPATDLLVRMQASRTHLAIVIDEYGGTEGLVSIEDLVEVIVGDIADEHDTEEDLEIKQLEEGIRLADGRVDLAQLEAQLGVDLLPEDEEEEADTLAGLIFKIAGRVPARGEIIRHESGLEFEILDSDPRRVRRVRINSRNVSLPNAEIAGDGSPG